MAREPAHVVGLRRALGQQLRAGRRAAGLSQGQVAKALNYDRSAISHLEAGRHPAPREFWEQADALLSADGGLLAAYDALAEAKLQAAAQTLDEATTLARQQWQVVQQASRSEKAEPRLDTAGHPAARATASQATDPVEPAVRSAAGAATLQWLFAPSASTAARTTGSLAVNDEDVVAITAMRRRLRALDDEHGGGAVVPMAVAYLRNHVTPLLNGRYTDRLGRRLFGAAAELTVTVGWMAYDAGSHTVARQQMVDALQLSQVARDRAVGAWILCAMSHHALHLGERAEALAFARAAGIGTTRVTPPAVQAMCAASEARAVAILGDKRACLSLLTRAEAALARVRAEEGPEWAVFFDQAELAGKSGRCLRDLGLHTDAERQLHSALTLHKPRFTRSRAITKLVYAGNYARQGQLEPACQLGVEALPVVGRLHSQRTREYLDDLSQQLQPYHRESIVRAFREHAQHLSRRR